MALQPVEALRALKLKVDRKALKALCSSQVLKLGLKFPSLIKLQMLGRFDIIAENYIWNKLDWPSDHSQHMTVKATMPYTTYLDRIGKAVN